MPTLFIQTLPSTAKLAGMTIACCAMSLLMLGERGKLWNFSVRGSNFTIPPWSIMPCQMFPSLSISISRLPCGKPLLNSEMGYSVTLPVLGSSLPRYCEPKSLYHAGDIDNHVMRHCDFARQIVFGNDDAPGPAGGRGSVFSGTKLEIQRRRRLWRNRVGAQRSSYSTRRLVFFLPLPH